MTPYALLFWDSFRGMFSLYLSRETSWFAAVDFGTYNILAITAICFVGSVLGAMCSAGIGYAVARIKDNILSIDEELYRKLSSNAAKYGIYIFLFQMMPFIKVLYFFAGLFQLPFRRLLLVTLVGRAFYYIYYLTILPLIPSL